MLAERLPPFIGVLKELPGRVGQGTVPGQNLGRVPPDASPEATATLLLGACFQRGFFRRFFGEDVLLPTADRFASELVRTLARGLSA